MSADRRPSDVWPPHKRRIGRKPPPSLVTADRAIKPDTREAAWAEVCPPSERRIARWKARG